MAVASNRRHNDGIPPDLSGDPTWLLGYDLNGFSRWPLVDRYFEGFGVGEFESADG